MPATISVGTMAMLCVSQASGRPSANPAAADRPAQIHNSSAVSPRTTTGWRFSRCGRKVTSVSRRVSEGTAIACRPYSTPVALVSSQMPTTSRIAPTATVRPNWPQVARPVWISE